jgi:hypothetical protein
MRCNCIMSLRCAECQCTPHECIQEDISNNHCRNCTKNVCCCLNIHQRLKYSINQFNRSRRIPFSIVRFLGHVKGFYAAALGIEILCIGAAEIGENSGLYMFGFNPLGIIIAYAMGYALAGFTTFVTILGRYNYDSEICSCCSVLEQDSKKGFIRNLKTTFTNFVIGIKKFPYLYKQSNLKMILKTSVVILITAESACILTAETVDLIFYQYSILLSISMALLAGAFTVVAPEAYRKVKSVNSTKSKINLS